MNKHPPSSVTPRLAVLILISFLTGCGSIRTPSKAWKDGYQLGRSDAVKQQYWIVQNQQRDQNRRPRPRISHVPIAVPSATNSAGVITVPATYKLRFED